MSEKERMDKMEARLDGHEVECNKRHAKIEGRFDRLEATANQTSNDVKWIKSIISWAAGLTTTLITLLLIGFGTLAFYLLTQG